METEPTSGPAGSHAPLILTATMERETAGRFEALRRAHFPTERNQVPAHVTLFHALPPSGFVDVAGRCRLLAQHTPPIEAEVTTLVSLGRGVAYRIDAPALDAIRGELADAWWTYLTTQDQGRPRMHVTVQNKVSAEVACASMAELTATFRPWRFRFVGLDLWRYLGGPWEAAGKFQFRGRAR